MANIYKLIDISEDPLYVKGTKEGVDYGMDKATRGNIRSIILTMDFDDAKIAYMLSVPIEYVAAVRREITDSKKID